MYMHGPAKMVLTKDVTSTYTDPVRPGMRSAADVALCKAWASRRPKQCGPVMQYMKSATRPAASFASDHTPPLTSLNSLALRQPLSGYFGDGLPDGATPTKTPSGDTGGGGAPTKGDTGGEQYPSKGDDGTSYPTSTAGRVPPTVIWFVLGVSLWLFARNRGR